MPMLHNSIRRVNDGAVHIKEESIERDELGRGGEVPGVADAAHD